MSKAMAHARGYYGRQLRDPGDVFHVPDGETSTWWTLIDGPGSASAETVVEDPAPAADEPVKRTRKKAEAPAPFAEAPEPVRVSNEINDATGATEPDWMAPASDI